MVRRGAVVMVSRCKGKGVRAEQHVGMDVDVVGERKLAENGRPKEGALEKVDLGVGANNAHWAK